MVIRWGTAPFFKLIGTESRARSLVPLQATSSDDPAFDSANEFDGNLLHVLGSEDFILPFPVASAWFDAAPVARRNIACEVQGMGHTGYTDNPGFFDTLPPDEQQRLHGRLVTGFLRAEVKGEEELYVDPLEEGISTEPLLSFPDCGDPTF